MCQETIIRWYSICCCSRTQAQQCATPSSRCPWSPTRSIIIRGVCDRCTATRRQFENVIEAENIRKFQKRIDTEENARILLNAADGEVERMRVEINLLSVGSYPTHRMSLQAWARVIWLRVFVERHLTAEGRGNSVRRALDSLNRRLVGTPTRIALRMPLENQEMILSYQRTWLADMPNMIRQDYAYIRDMSRALADEMERLSDIRLDEDWVVTGDAALREARTEVLIQVHPVPLAVDHWGQPTDDACFICYQPWGEPGSGQEMAELLCHHPACKECMLTWLRSSKACYKCRKSYEDWIMRGQGNSGPLWERPEPEDPSREEPQLQTNIADIIW